MNDETPYQQRYRAVLRHLNAKSNTQFVKALGVTENAKALAHNWFNRDGRIPETYRKPLASFGISIDWVNSNEGSMLMKPEAGSQSQSVGRAREMLGLAVRVIDHVRDMALEPIASEREDELLDLALDEAAAALSAEGATPKIPDVARRVAARFRTGG